LLFKINQDDDFRIENENKASKLGVKVEKDDGSPAAKFVERYGHNSALKTFT